SAEVALRPSATVAVIDSGPAAVGTTAVSPSTCAAAAGATTTLVGATESLLATTARCSVDPRSARPVTASVSAPGSVSLPQAARNAAEVRARKPRRVFTDYSMVFLGKHDVLRRILVVGAGNAQLAMVRFAPAVR